MVLEKMDIHLKKINVDTDLKSFTVNLKWIIDLNVNCETIKPLEYNIGEKLDDFGAQGDTS